LNRDGKVSRIKQQYSPSHEAHARILKTLSDGFNKIFCRIAIIIRESD